MKKVTLIILVFLFSAQTFSQSPNWLWANAVGGANQDYGWTSALDVYGNVYISGTFEGTVDFDPGVGVFNLTAAGNTQDIYILKLNPTGNFIWAKQISGSGYENAKFIYIDPSGSGDIFITGNFQGTTDFDPGPGAFNITGSGMFISRLDSSCNLIWAKTISGTNCGYSIVIDPAGSGALYTTGVFQGIVDFDPGIGVFNMTSAGQYDIYISKFDLMGNFIWARRIGGPACDWGFSIAFDPSGSGSIYTTGAFENTVDFDPGIGVYNLTGASMYICKLDSAGNFVWAKAMVGTSIYDAGNCIVVDPLGSGDVYTTGSFLGTVDFDPGVGTFNLTSAGASDIFISKLDASGNFVWAKSMGGAANNDIAFSLDIDPSGSGDIYTTGFFMGTADFDPGSGTFNLTAVGNNTDVFISKLTASGDFVWAKAVGGSGYDRGQSIALDALGHLYVVGYFSSPFISFGSNTFTNQDSTGYKADIFIAELGTEIVTGNDGIENFTYDFSLSPNPAVSELIIRSSEFGDKSVVVYDVLGEKVFNQKTKTGNQQQLSIDISELKPGVYFVALTDDKRNKITRKFVKL